MAGRQINVLLIDDETDFLAATAKALGKRGMRVATASTFDEARALFRSFAPDVAVLDVRMPDGDGHEFYFELKALRPTSEFIFLTGHGDIRKAFEMGSQGAAAYLGKPCDPEDLAVEIRKAAGVRDLASEQTPPRGQPTIRVLLVDDEADFLDSMRRVLSRRGLAVSCASSGPEALEFLATNAADVAVVDVKMPLMDGFELLRRIKRTAPQIEVILLTGHATVEVAIRCMEEGAFDYLIKPHDPDALAAKIAAAAGKGREANGSS